MSDFLSYVITTLAALPIGLGIGFSAKKNSYWSTADFLPLVFWTLLGTFIGIAAKELIKYIFRVDSEILLKLVYLVGPIVSGCGIYWYRTRTPKQSK